MGIGTDGFRMSAPRRSLVPEGVRQAVAVWIALSRRRRVESIGLILLQVVSAGMEALSLAVALPFIEVLAAGEGSNTYSWAMDWFDPLSESDGVVVVALVFATTVALSGVLRLACIWVTTRLSLAIMNDLTVEAFRTVLYQPYAVHLRYRSGEAQSTILSKVELVSYAVVRPVLTLVGSALTIAMVAGALLLVSPVASAAVFGGVSLGYGAALVVTRRRLNRNSRILASTKAGQFRVVEDTLGGVRDLLLDGTQEFFVARFRRVDASYRRATGSNQIISSAPRFVLESVSLLVVAVVAIWLSRADGGLGDSLPVLGVVTLGGLRLFPALQLAYSAWTTQAGAEAVIAEALELLNETPTVEEPDLAPLPFERAIRLKDVCFRYEGGETDVFDGLDIEIGKGQRVGIIGPTGEGKSTLLDLLMGLVEPTGGLVSVDGVNLENLERRRWMRAVAHVPQHIFLADASIRENITFGLESEDEQRLMDAVRTAQLEEVVSGRTGGLDVMIGSSGMYLSGGQRQRVGIARALYRRADVLVLDEATSALDPETERRVLEGIRRLDGDVTIIQVAHRLTSVADCDRVLEVANGGVRTVPPSMTEGGWGLGEDEGLQGGVTGG